MAEDMKECLVGTLGMGKEGLLEPMAPVVLGNGKKEVKLKLSRISLCRKVNLRLFRGEILKKKLKFK